MSFELRTETKNVGSRDWLEASKNLGVRAYLPSIDTVEITVESLERNTQFTVTGHDIPTLVSREYESAQLTEELNEVYDGDLDEEEKQITRHVREYHRRRLSAG